MDKNSHCADPGQKMENIQQNKSFGNVRQDMKFNLVQNHILLLIIKKLCLLDDMKKQFNGSSFFSAPKSISVPTSTEVVILVCL